MKIVKLELGLIAAIGLKGITIKNITNDIEVKDNEEDEAP